ncbi:hypothetical protein SBADM41S_02146 [Streptomyces badius]
MPPVTESTPITIRKITGSTSQYRRSPPHTPATTFCRGVRRSVGFGASGGATPGGGGGGRPPRHDPDGP